jgi:hypothetical protein
MSDIDTLLRQPMAAPVPRLSPDFHQSLSRELQRRSRPPHPFGRILLTAYAGVSMIVSSALMRSQGLGWLPIAALTLAPLAVLALAQKSARRVR